MSDKVKVKIILEGTVTWPKDKVEEWRQNLELNNEHAWFSAWDSLAHAPDPQVTIRIVSSSLTKE